MSIVLLAITIMIEVAGGLMLITGFKPRAAAIALFLIPATILFHAFWSADAANFQNHLTAFLKNLAILSGMLLVIEREQSVARPQACHQRFQACGIDQSGLI